MREFDLVTSGWATTGTVSPQPQTGMEVWRKVRSLLRDGLTGYVRLHL